MTRNPNADNLRYVHLYNSYLTNNVERGIYIEGSTEAGVENCYVSGTRNPLFVSANRRLQASGMMFENCNGTRAGNKGTVFDPRSFYSYTLDATKNVPSIVKANAGRQASVCSA